MTYSFDELRRYLDDLPSRFDVPGYDCLIIHKGENVFRHTAGWADRENKIPLTKDHFYNLYSASKPVTCAVALHAMEEGRYLMQLPVSYYIPEFKNLTYKHKNEDGSEEIRPVTKPMLVQDLFTMCGGFNYNTQAPAIAELKASNPDFTAFRTKTLWLITSLPDTTETKPSTIYRATATISERGFPKRR